MHNFQVTKIGGKKKAKMATIDFINIQGRQNFEDDAEINPINIKIVNDKIQKISKKTLSNSLSKGYFFQVVLKMAQKK